MITFPVLFINVLAVIMMALVILACWRVRAKQGASELFVASIFMIIWALGSFLELVSDSFEVKVLWRNFTQIGVFYTSAATIIFSVSYTGYLAKLKKQLVVVLYTYQSLGLLLVLTDSFHHLIRKNIQLVRGDFLGTVVVDTTLFGKFLITGNFLLLLIAFLMLVLASITATKSSKEQIYSVLLGMVIPIIYALLKVISNEQFLQLLPISGVFALSGFFMLLGINRYDLLKIAPLAHQQVFRFLGDGIIICSTKAEVVDANPHAHDLLGEQLETIEQVLKQKVPYWERKVLEGKQMEFEFHLGQKFLHADFYPISNDAQEVVGSVTLIKDVTVLKERSDWLKSKAEIDSLTGLYNRQTFIEKVETELERTFSEVHLLYFDLDHFKMVNDKYGHRAGDLLLAEVGKLSQRTGCVAGRMGGEEFALFSAIHNRQRMEELAEELRISIASLDLVHEGKEIHATISAGLASLTNPTFDQIYHLADSLLYQAKREGRNCVRF